MVPSLRRVRKAATKKRKIPVDAAPAEKRAVTKKVKRTERGETSQRFNAGRGEVSTSASDESEAPQAEAGGGPAQIGEAEAEKRPDHSDSDGIGSPRPLDPASPLCPIEVIDTSPEKEDRAPAPVETGPADLADEPVLEIPSPSRLATTFMPLPTQVPGETGSGGGSSSAVREMAAEGSSNFSFRSLLENQGQWADRAIEKASLPEIHGFLRQQEMSVFLREASMANLWALNSMTALRGLWAHASETLGLSLEELFNLRAKVEKSEAALEEALLDAAQAKKGKAEADASRSGMEVALEEARRQAARELDNAQVAEERQKAAEAEVFLLKNRLHAANIEIGVAEERAENAEEIARQKDAEAAFLQAVVGEAKEQALKAEERASGALKEVAEAEKMTAEAERKMAEAMEKAAEAGRKVAEAEGKIAEAGEKAVERFRKSKDFDIELAESSASAYNGGFQDCKEKIRRLFGLEGIDELEPDDYSDGSDSDSE